MDPIALPAEEVARKRANDERLDQLLARLEADPPRTRERQPVTVPAEH